MCCLYACSCMQGDSCSPSSPSSVASARLCCPCAGCLCPALCCASVACDRACLHCRRCHHRHCHAGCSGALLCVTRPDCRRAVVPPPPARLLLLLGRRRRSCLCLALYLCCRWSADARLCSAPCPCLCDCRGFCGRPCRPPAACSIPACGRLCCYSAVSCCCSRSHGDDGRRRPLDAGCPPCSRSWPRM